MARKTLTEEEVAAKVAGCMSDIGDEWRRFVQQLEQFVETFKYDVERQDWNSAREIFALFKTYMRKRTTESVRLSDKLLGLKKELSGIRGRGTTK